MKPFRVIRVFRGQVFRAPRGRAFVLLVLAACLQASRGVALEEPPPPGLRGVNKAFRNNRTQTTGSGLDLLHGSAATVENCLFVGNVANMGVGVVGLLAGGGFHPENGSGAITVFADSKATVSRSTLTGNWSGVDDAGRGSTYVDSIFWKNTLGGGISPGKRYEIDIEDGAGVRGSFVHGAVNDLRTSTRAPR